MKTDFLSLNQYETEMKALAEKIVAESLKGQFRGAMLIRKSPISIDGEIPVQKDLLLAMLRERKEFQEVKEYDNDIHIRIADAYVQDQERDLKELTDDEVEIMCAKHVLWLLNAGGEQADFSHCKLTYSDMMRYNLRNAVFENALFVNMRLTDANFYGAKLRNAQFQNCFGERCNMDYADLRGVKFSRCRISDSYFEHCNLSQVRFCGNEELHIIFRNCCLSDTDFGMADMDKCRAWEIDYNEEQWLAREAEEESESETPSHTLC